MVDYIKIKTGSRTELLDITGKVQSIVDASGVREGLCTVYIPHTTAGITINENADPDVVRDMVTALNKIVPFEDNYRHMEGNSAAHIKATMTGFSQTIIIHQGRLLLGTWQGIYFCEFDGPRDRKAVVKIMEG